MRKILVFLLLLASASSLAQNDTLDWTHRVRIGGYGLSADNASAIVNDAVRSNVFGIEIDNDLTGRYDSFLDPAAKLEAIRRLAERAHASGQKAFVYTAGLECITGRADEKQHTFFKDHPDWVQRKITGEPAVFTGGAAFWIDKGDEDVWISPYATEWRRLYMQRIREIATTGIDGVYVDIPYWMTHFDGWEDSGPASMTTRSRPFAPAPDSTPARTSASATTKILDSGAGFAFASIRSRSSCARSTPM